MKKWHQVLASEMTVASRGASMPQLSSQQRGTINYCTIILYILVSSNAMQRAKLGFRVDLWATEMTLRFDLNKSIEHQWTICWLSRRKINRALFVPPVWRLLRQEMAVVHRHGLAKRRPHPGTQTRRNRGKTRPKTHHRREKQDPIGKGRVAWIHARDQRQWPTNT